MGSQFDQKGSLTPPWKIVRLWARESWGIPGDTPRCYSVGGVGGEEIREREGGWVRERTGCTCLTESAASQLGAKEEGQPTEGIVFGNCIRSDTAAGRCRKCCRVLPLSWISESEPQGTPPPRIGHVDAGNCCQDPGRACRGKRPGELVFLSEPGGREPHLEEWEPRPWEAVSEADKRQPRFEELEDVHAKLMKVSNMAELVRLARQLRREALIHAPPGPGRASAPAIINGIKGSLPSHRPRLTQPDKTRNCQLG